jgi:hypothetical protein
MDLNVAIKPNFESKEKMVNGFTIDKKGAGRKFKKLKGLK